MSRPEPYSRRTASKPDTLQYHLPENVRLRIFHTLQQLSRTAFPAFDFQVLLNQMGQRLLTEYGSLCASGYDAANYCDDPVVNHFMVGDDALALDFIELIFQCRVYSAGDEGRKLINAIFQQEGIGYELTPYVVTEIPPKTKPKPGAPNYIGQGGGVPIEVQYPQIIELDSEYMHAEVVHPCLDLLSDPKFKIANEEMLKAHQEYRDGNYADAITDCGAAFETVMKTICEAKGWTYDKGKATCKDLIAICKDKGLFPSFYVSFFEGAGTIRNKLGDAHGKGPKPEFTATKEHFEHMVQITSANILFLARLANI